MARFEKITKGFHVFFEESFVGFIGRDGFVIYSRGSHLIVNNPNDLEDVAKKLREIKHFGYDIPACPECEQTPLFPAPLGPVNEIAGGMRIQFVCGNDFHEIHAKEIR